MIEDLERGAQLVAGRLATCGFQQPRAKALPTRIWRNEQANDLRDALNW
jgi:hypothetical protein